MTRGMARDAGRHDPKHDPRDGMFAARMAQVEAMHAEGSGAGHSAARRIDVLVVEDDERDAFIVARLLERSKRFDATVTIRRTAGEALESLRAGGFDVCILDYWLDDSHAVDLLDRAGPLRAPIILLTGVDTALVEDDAFDRGAVTCLNKMDLNGGALDSMIVSALRRGAERERDGARLREMSERLAQRTDAMADLAHEVGNLTSAARTASALSDMGRGGGHDGLLNDYVEQMHATTRAMLDEAGSDGAGSNGEGVGEVKSHDLRVLAGRIERLCAPLVDATGHRLAVGAAPRDRLVTLDAVLLMQAVLNLVTNAAKYSAEDGPIDVRLARAGDELRVSVTDEGPGMSAEQIDRVRRRGERGANERGGDGAARDGYGLGLNIVERHLARMGGRLEAESEPGKGTVMTLVVPAG